MSKSMRHVHKRRKLHAQITKKINFIKHKTDTQLPIETKYCHNDVKYPQRFQELAK